MQPQTRGVTDIDLGSGHGSGHGSYSGSSPMTSDMKIDRLFDMNSKMIKSMRNGKEQDLTPEDILNQHISLATSGSSQPRTLNPLQNVTISKANRKSQEHSSSSTSASSGAKEKKLNSSYSGSQIKSVPNRDVAGKHKSLQFNVDAIPLSNVTNNTKSVPSLNYGKGSKNLGRSGGGVS